MRVLKDLRGHITAVALIVLLSGTFSGILINASKKAFAPQISPCCKSFFLRKFFSQSFNNLFLQSGYIGL